MRGKRRVEDGDLVVPKRASAHRRHMHKPSVGSSPLATEVSNTQSSEHSDSPLQKELAPAGSHDRRSIRSSLNSNETSPASVLLSNNTAQSRHTSAIGHDTDPAQIVNLALNLSESRRRNLSAGGLLVPRDSVGAKRLVSSGHSPLSISSSANGGSLKQYLNQQRQISRNVSPRSGRSASSKGNSPQLSQQARDEKRRSSALPDFRAGISEDTVLDVSDASLNRVEKARVAIELSYEYRRLLQWLPKLPTSSQSRPSTNKGGLEPQAYPAAGLGRTYNPLQYIRNRKLRFKEDAPLDSEAQGWTDIDNVREWVDTVANEREDGISRVDKRFPLPPFDPSQRGLGIADGIESSGNPSSQARKIARPHTVWEFHSWDLLADSYWLNQDDNVTRIEDSHGKKIVADRRLPREDRPRTSKDSVRDPIRRSESMFRLNRSPDKVRASFESFRSDSKERGRRRQELQEPRSPVSDDNGSRTRKTRWPRKFVRSRSPSSSGDSHKDKRRGRARGLAQLRTRDDHDSAVLEKHMMDMLAKEAEDSEIVAQEINNQTNREAGSNKATNDGSRANGQVVEAPRRRPNAPRRLKTDKPTAGKHATPARASLDEERFHHHRMSSDDFGSTAPNSPAAPGFVPSIAINLSPPASPPTSAVSPKKMLPTKLGPFRRTRSPNGSKRAVSENDFALESGTSTDISRQTTNESQLVNMLRKERSIDPSNGLLSPTKSEFFGKGSRPLGNSSIRSIKDTTSSDSRLRGLFKGGRIAELVGSEVSKMGDMFWRKDSGSHISQPNSPVTSAFASEDSDVDDGDVSGLDNSPEDDLSQTVSRIDGKGRLSQSSTNSEIPRFHIDNLPSFRSTFARDEISTKPTESSIDHDHITRQQMLLRERGRSSRFDRLAPPKIDMRGISPPPSRTSSPEKAKSASRGSSSSRSDRRVRSADRRLNAMLDTPGKVGTGNLAPTGLLAFSSHRSGSQGRPALDDKRQWSISDKGVSAVRGTITKRDIARVRALLLSSGVKANEIGRRAEETPENPSPFLRDLKHFFQDEVPHLPRSQEYAVAGRLLVNNIETTTRHLRDAAEQFSHTVVENLHDQIKAIEDRVNYKLTPLVRAAADDADNFGTELTTTHTLAVKQLNDSVDVILRRRRRRLRWIRSGGWAMLEWALLAIMWLAWFVVLIVRVVRGTIRGVGQCVRWLFWL